MYEIDRQYFVSTLTIEPLLRKHGQRTIVQSPHITFANLVSFVYDMSQSQVLYYLITVLNIKLLLRYNAPSCCIMLA